MRKRTEDPGQLAKRVSDTKKRLPLKPSITLIGERPMNLISEVFLSIVLFFIVIPVLATKTAGQAPTAQTSSGPITNGKTSAVPEFSPARDFTPVVSDWEPKRGSVNSVIELRGLRLDLSNDTDETTRILFIQNGVELSTRSTGGSGALNDEFNGEQTRNVIVPEEAMTGVGYFVIERNGRRSTPAMVTITEWKAPTLKELTPTSGPPGTIVGVECEGFHLGDEIELTDAATNRVRIDGGGGSSSCTLFKVPEDVAEGVLTVRLRNQKYGKGQHTPSLTFTVTTEPLPADLVPDWMKTVAPGQWLDLQTTNMVQLQRSERTEVAFKQAGRTIIVALAKPSRPHVEVPTALSPGEVQLQTRTWLKGQPSQWSQPFVISLPEKPVPPAVSAIRRDEGSWVHLWPGPDRPNTLRVSPGEALVFNGLWPVENASKLSFSLVRPGEVIELKAEELNANADWFGDLRVHLPDSLGFGNWRLIASSEEDGSQEEVPLVIKVVPKAMQ